MTFHPLAPAGPGPGAAPPDREKIREAARGFEGLFLAQLLKIMKNSVPGSKDQTLLRSDALTEFADLEFARVLAERRGIGLSDMLYRSLARSQNQESEAGASSRGLPLEPAARVPVPLKPSPSPLPVEPAETPRAAPQVTLSSPLEPIIERAARRHGLHPQLLKAVIACESSGNPRAESPRGAKGLMQLADSTAQMLGVRDVWDPEENVEGGARYLKTLLNRFDHRLDWALAAYNAGPTAVERHGGVPPYDETERYVKKVLDHYQGPRVEDRHGS